MARIKKKKLRIAPLATVDRVECVARQTVERVVCPTCEKTFAAAVNYRIARGDSDIPLIVQRVAFCDCCEQVFWWDQPADENWDPTGRPIDGSLVTCRRSSVVERVLKTYPQIRGVHQV